MKKKAHRKKHRTHAGQRRALPSWSKNLNVGVLLGTGTTLFANGVSAQTLEEVVVTASRREQSLQDIPYSITAVSAESLEENRVDSLTDLSQLVAGISFADAGPTSRNNLVLRGINANATDQPSTNTVAPVSTYLGETPIFLSLQISDIERVEVLRGPQGTLYGSGSLAGTVRFIPRRPDPSAFSAEVEGDVAEVAATDELNGGLAAILNIPLGEASALRFSGGYKHYAGFIDERYLVVTGDPSTAIRSPIGIPVPADPDNELSALVFSPKDDANDADVWHGRASYLFEPSEKFSMLLTYFHQDTEDESVQAHSPSFVGSVDTPPAANPYWSPAYPVSFPTGGTIFPANGRYDANNSFLLSSDRKTDLGSADLTYDFGFASLSSSTSYYEDSGKNVSDNTGLLTLYPDFYGFIPRMVDLQNTEDETKGFVEELRLVSNTGERFDYVLGLFYQKLEEDSGQLQWIPGQTYFGTLVGNPGGNPDTLGDINVIGETQTEFEDRALFGELTYHITDKWQITGGVRAFEQDFDLTTFTSFPFCGIFCSNIDDQAGTTFVSESSSVSDQIFKLNSAYAPSDNANLYVNYAEGFRRGGTTGIPISGPFAGNPELLTYDPDQTKNYEVGAKGRFGGISYSFAVFYIDWLNFQVDDNAASSGFAIAVNGARAESKGVELELYGALSDRLTYRLGYAFSDAEVAEDFSVMDLENGPNGTLVPVAIVESSKGDPLPNSPKHSATGAVDFTHAAPSFLEDWQMSWHVNATYRSSTLSQLVSSNPSDPPPFEIDAFSVWDASVNLSNESTTISLYVDNIFDELAMTGGSDRGSVGLRAEQFYVGRPRTLGLKLRYRF
jgi:outer membrane receptor protein involved in Fe transport